MKTNSAAGDSPCGFKCFLRKVPDRYRNPLL